ncbi:MAG: sodium:proton antiporter [Spirosomataceae bacterium]
MTIFYTIAILITICSIFSYINIKFIKLPSSIGLMLISLLLSLLILVIGNFDSSLKNLVVEFMSNLDFGSFLMQYMLCFLLFAGSLHVNFNLMKEQKWAIMAFTILGVLMATFLIGYGFYYLGQWLNFNVPLIVCLLFGALISPTDPIAVLGILKQAKVPKSEEVVITGESLFNDGVGVVLFLTILQIANGTEPVTGGEVVKLLFQEVAGGILLGLVFGFLGSKLLKTIDHYQTEVMITLAIVMGGYSLASFLHTSGPLAMVVAGLVIGNYGREVAMSDITRKYVDTFWELVDELLNAFLFVLIGFEIVAIPSIQNYWFIGLLSILLALMVRFFSVYLPFKLFGLSKQLNDKFPIIMTWGGLRGGISIALALSLPNSEHKGLILAVTYAIVLFSVLVQGLSVSRLKEINENGSYGILILD